MREGERRKGRSAQQTVPADLDTLKARLKAAKPGIPVELIDSAKTVQELAENVLGWARTHDPTE